VCPTKSCAVKWAKKIDDATLRLGNREGPFGGYRQELDSPTKRHNVSQINNMLNTNTQGSNFNPNLNSNPTFNTNLNKSNPHFNLNQGSNAVLTSQAHTLGSNFINNHIRIDDGNYFEGQQMSKVEDFIASRKVDKSGGFEPELLRRKSISKMSVQEKDIIRK
jgi:hypothetical protein